MTQAAFQRGGQRSFLVVIVLFVMDILTVVQPFLQLFISLKFRCHLSMHLGCAGGQTSLEDIRNPVFTRGFQF
jgi:hypothetical protein